VAEGHVRIEAVDGRMNAERDFERLPDLLQVCEPVPARDAEFNQGYGRIPSAFARYAPWRDPQRYGGRTPVFRMMRTKSALISGYAVSAAPRADRRSVSSRSQVLASRARRLARPSTARAYQGAWRHPTDDLKAVSGSERAAS
jgi:hypothetical protein